MQSHLNNNQVKRRIEMRAYFYFFILILSLSPTLSYPDASNPKKDEKKSSFKKIGELKEGKKRGQTLLTILALDNNNKSVEFWAKNINRGYIQDDFGLRYKTLNDQLKSKGVMAGPLDIDASKSGRKIRGIDDVEDDNTELLKNDRAQIYLKYHQLIGRNQNLLMLGEVITQRYIPETQNQQKINTNPRILDYQVYFVEDFFDTLLDSELIPQDKILFASDFSRSSDLKLTKYCKDCTSFNSSDQNLEINLSKIRALSKTDLIKSKIVTEALEEIFIAHCKTTQYFLEGINDVGDNIVLAEYPNFITTSTSLYIIVPKFFTDQKKIDLAINEIKKKLPLKEKNTDKSKDKAEVEHQLLLQSTNFIENQYYFWMFIQLYKDNVDPKTFSNDYLLFRETLSEMVDDEFDKRR